VASGPLRKEYQAEDNEGEDDRRGEWTADRKPTFSGGLVEEVPDRRAEWPRKNEGDPEKPDTR
jgi:hypothetical protein